MMQLVFNVALDWAEKASDQWFHNPEKTKEKEGGIHFVQPYTYFLDKYK